MEPKRLYRSTTDRKIAGVAGGLADYFEIDPLLIRLVFIILAVSGGAGLFIYIVLWIATPDRPYSTQSTNNNPNPQPRQPDQPNNGAQNETTFTDAPPSINTEDVKPKHRRKGSLTGGLVLITIGALFMAAELIPQVNFWDLWPVILIVAGVGLLIKAIVNRNQNINQY
jgi:phage shock protein PspC (stress-responsive transcriptional regulator)